MPTPSPLSLRALAKCQEAADRGIRGGLPGWGQYRGQEVDSYQTAAGLELPAHRSERGYPWCCAAQYAVSKEAETEAEKSFFPRTAGCLKAAERFPEHCKLAAPQAGAVFIVKHADGKTGHAGRVEHVYEDGSIQTVEGDTNAAGSSHGDAWGRHRWNPATGARGELLGYWDDGLSAPAPLVAEEPPAGEPAEEPICEAPAADPVSDPEHSA